MNINCLLADNGRSKREKVFMWEGATLCAMCLDELKIVLKAHRPQAQWLNIDMATMENTGVPWLFNLFIDPKEQYTVGHRLNAFLASMGNELEAHMATFKKYPPKNIGLPE